MKKICLVIMAVTILLICLTSCAQKPLIESGPLTREDFNFYNGNEIKDADGRNGYISLDRDWQTARGFKRGDSLQRFLELYGGFPCNIYLNRVSGDGSHYYNALIHEEVPDVLEGEYEFIIFDFIHDGYVLECTYWTEREEFSILAKNPLVRARSELFESIRWFGREFGDTPELNILSGEHLQVVSALSETIKRMDAESKDEGGFGVPYQIFFDSITEADKEIYDVIALQVWQWWQSYWTMELVTLTIDGIPPFKFDMATLSSSVADQFNTYRFSEGIIFDEGIKYTDDAGNQYIAQSADEMFVNAEFVEFSFPPGTSVNTGISGNYIVYEVTGFDPVIILTFLIDGEIYDFQFGARKTFVAWQSDAGYILRPELTDHSFRR